MKPQWTVAFRTSSSTLQTCPSARRPLGSFRGKEHGQHPPPHSDHLPSHLWSLGHPAGRSP